MEGRITRAVRAHLERANLTFSYHDERKAFWILLGQRQHRHLLDVWVDDDRGQLAVRNTLPVNVPEERRAAMAEFILRMNFGMIIGGADMDFRDGEVRFRASVDFDGLEGEVPDGMIFSLISISVAMMHQYLPGMYRVIYGSCPPDEAVADCERPREDGAEDRERRAAENAKRRARARARTAGGRPGDARDVSGLSEDALLEQLTHLMEAHLPGSETPEPPSEAEADTAEGSPEEPAPVD
jgi:hypothetical protein